MSRTTGSTTLHPDWRLHLWLAIQVLCETRVSKTGRKITPSAAAKILHETGGLFGIVGGDHGLLAEHNATRTTRLVEMCVVKEQGLVRLKEESCIVDKQEIISRVFVSHRCQHFRTLLQRYYEIAKNLTNPCTKLAWNNILADLLGRPRQHLPWTRSVPFMSAPWNRDTFRTD